MCGIAGYVGREPLAAERVAAALPLIRHRGPDHQAHHAWETPDGRRIEMLHARLSIIDLAERANQPFRSGDTTVVFNGELYNYLEVRDQLGREGREFRTSSDTEALAAALDQWGVDGLDRCEGMWAFAAIDEADGSVVLSRDRFGEKPLYLVRDEQGVWFGSEVKLITALRGRPLRVNARHLQRYLVNGYKSLYKTRETFFEGLEELPPGSWLRIGTGNDERTGRYWDVPRPAAQDDMSYEEAVAGTRERLIRATELRMRADVPLAFCMSGGVDSMSLISIAKRVFDYDVHGFTIVNSDERYEESDMVDHSVDVLGLRHTPIPVDTADFLPRLRELVGHHDAPVYTITYFAHWLLMRSIHEHGYRISISGSAADELYSGYYDHHLAYLQEVHGEPAVHGPAKAAWLEHVRPIVRNPFLQNPDFFVENPGARDHIYLDAKEFAGYLSRPFDEPFTEVDYADTLLRRRMLNELFHESVPVILHEDDLNAMYFSIENRSPFLDRELFEFSLRIPTRHLVRDGKAKAVLRESMRGIAPDRIIDNRRKVGFNAPILDFLDVEDGEVRAELLADSPIWEHVRRERVEELLDLRPMPNSRSKFLFYFLCAKLFLEENA